MPLANVPNRPDLRRARRPACFALLLLGLTTAPAGCMSYGPPAPTTVAQGQYFSTGNPDYDEFFVRLYRLQLELGQAPAELGRTRGALAQKLGVAEKAEAAALKTALTERAAELRSRGITARLESSREAPGTTTLRTSGTPSAADSELVTALEQTLAATNRIQKALPAWRTELEALPPRGVVLESGLESAFIGKGRAERNEIRENLADAQKIMGLMGPRLKELETGTDELAEALAATFPPPAPPPPEPPAPEPEAKPKPRSGRAAGGARPAAAKPAPKPAQNDGSSEGPAPAKPAQGTAKPDFEP
jgi:hypothetical protein